MCRKSMLLYFKMNKVDQWDFTALHRAAVNGHTDTVQVLLKHRMNVQSVDLLGYTPLHRTAEHGHTLTTKLLLDHSAEVNGKDSVGFTPLHRAVVNGHTNTARVLINYGANVNSQAHAPSHLTQTTNKEEQTEDVLHEKERDNGKYLKL